MDNTTQTEGADPQESLQKSGAGSAPKGVSADMLDQLIQEGQELRKAFDVCCVNA